MSTKGSREQDRIVEKAERDMRGSEAEKNPSHPCGPDCHSAGAIGGGDQEGRKGKIVRGEKD